MTGVVVFKVFLEYFLWSIHRHSPCGRAPFCQSQNVEVVALIEVGVSGRTCWSSCWCLTRFFFLVIEFMHCSRGVGVVLSPSRISKLPGFRHWGSKGIEIEWQSDWERISLTYFCVVMGYFARSFRPTTSPKILWPLPIVSLPEMDSAFVFWVRSLTCALGSNLASFEVSFRAS